MKNAYQWVSNGRDIEIIWVIFLDYGVAILFEDVNIMTFWKLKLSYFNWRWTVLEASLKSVRKVPFNVCKYSLT